MTYSSPFKNINTSFRTTENQTLTLQEGQIADASEVLAYA